MIAHADKDTIRRDRAALEAELRNAGARIRGNTFTCINPDHDDRHASGSIHQGDDGAWRAKCHVCDTRWDVFDVAALNQGRDVADVLPGSNRPQTPRVTSEVEPTDTANDGEQAHGGPQTPRVAEKRPPRTFDTLDALKAAVPGHVEATYVYTDPQTCRPDLVVVRFIPRDRDRKQFWQARPHGDGFALEAPPKPWPLYNRSRVAEADIVVVTEGEKCVHALHDIGIIATTSPGGAGKAEHADWSPLAGKTVYLWPDHDEAGIQHMQTVARLLDRLDPAPRVHWIDPAATLNLPPKGDACDYLHAMAGASQADQRRAVDDVLADAESMGANREVWALLEATISGQRRAIAWPWRATGSLTKALLPGTVTILCGDPGATKSFMLLEAAAYWHARGERVALYELEEDRAFHLCRVLAQQAGDGRLTDDDHIRCNPDDAREAHALHAGFLDAFGRCIWAAPDEPVSLPDLTKWVRQRAEAGCRIIAVDPVTAAQSSDKQWLDDQKFIIECKAAIRETGASLVLVTHPKKGRKGVVGLDELAGGASYVRFSQTVLWLETHHDPKVVNITTPMGTAEQDINRTLHLCKARNGKGAGLAVGYTFDSDTLRFTEHGIIRKAGVETTP